MRSHAAPAECLSAPWQISRGSRATSHAARVAPTSHWIAQVCKGTTGHAEAVQVTFNPAQVAYGDLLKLFFTVHDPTQLNRQGPDVGTQYRSMVVYMNDAQKAEVESFLSKLAKDRVYGSKRIVTQVVPYKAFYPAEAYHQHYAELHPDDIYIVYNDRPKVEALKKRFPQLYRDIK